MKDKEKQIEEILTDIRKFIGYDTPYTQKKALADYLFEHYQPKLPEDSVVLSREEQDKLYQKGFDDGKQFAEKFYKPLVKAETRKETAEKILKLADNKLDLYRNGVIGGSLYDSGYQTAIYDIKRIIKEQFSVEIKE